MTFGWVSPLQRLDRNHAAIHVDGRFRVIRSPNKDRECGLSSFGSVVFDQPGERAFVLDIRRQA